MISVANKGKYADQKMKNVNSPGFSLIAKKQF